MNMQKRDWPFHALWRSLLDMRLRIRELREAKGWNQTQLGERAGYSQSKISRLERGVKIELDVLANVAQALEVAEIRVFDFSDADELSSAIDLLGALDIGWQRAIVDMATKARASSKPAA